MADIIYYFETIEGLYIGKLASMDYVQEHLGRAFNNLFKIGKTTASNGIAWDYRLRDDISLNGYKNSNYIIRAGYTTVETVKKNFIAKYGEGIWNNFCKMWHKGDKEVAEAICILVAAKEYPLLNTKIDFMQQVPLTKTDIMNTLFSKEEIKRRWGAILNNLRPAVFLTFRADQFKSLDNLKVNKNGKVVTQILRNKKVLEEINNKIRSTTYKHILVQFEKRREKISPYIEKDIVTAAEAEILDNIISTIGNWISGDTKKPPKTYAAIFSWLNEQYKKWVEDAKKKTSKFKDMIPKDDAIDSFVTVLKKWYEQVELSSFYSFEENEDSGWKEKGAHWFKFQMCKWFSDMFDKNFPFDKAYNEELYRRLKKNEFNSSHTDRISIDSENTRTMAFSRIYATFNNKPFEGNLKFQAKEKIVNNTPMLYWQANWEKIYIEQVTHWLSKKGNAFVIEERDKITNFDQSPEVFENVDDINFY